jgi:hypothetical protein
VAIVFEDPILESGRSNENIEKPKSMSQASVKVDN